MKITISGSLFFAKEIVELQKKLQKLWHTVYIPSDTEAFLTWAVNDRSHQIELARKWMFDHYNNVTRSDGILVANFEKKNIKGYIWWAVLVEMGIATYLGKKIFILNDIPDEKEIRYVQEIQLMLPIIINGDLTKIQ
jgi:hypothetical protein